MVDGLTPTQRRMFDVLSDGIGHTTRELHACLYDDAGPLSNIRAHLTALREKLRPRGRDVRSERLAGVVYYRLVQVVAGCHRGAS